MDTSLFFEQYESSKKIQLKIDSICASCPVQQECKQYAIDNNCDGTWGKVYFKPKMEKK